VYRIEILKQAEKSLVKITTADQPKIVSAILSLADEIRFLFGTEKRNVL